MPPNGKPHLINPGDKFGRLTTVGFSHNDKRYRRHYTVRCDCGTIKTVQGALLRSGNTQSCGCLGEEARRARRTSIHHSDITAVILGYKRHALDRGLPWNLTREQVVQIIGRPCHYCGLPPSNIKSTKNSIVPFPYSGIDRLDNEKGYDFDNVVACCARCNIAKGTMTVSEFLSWVRRVSAMAEQWGEPR